ncbi:hypothetical protein SAMN05443668_1078 [Cryptosporangium aurantiacum]|uniref:Uncharacterized protein n=2 Tax=Cryptosporangium aurantiacum TaxID=134849 RepID=A0A1M7TTS4_9ACTN|nr:hypothetical protein SAMN05443668_1078 [Cryptosporangium aurantiacum]
MRPWPLVIVWLLVSAGLARVWLTADSVPDAVCGSLLGLLAVTVLSLAFGGVVWAAAGGDVTAVAVGVGPVMWVRFSPTGRSRQVHVAPVGVTVRGYGARPGRHPRTPFRAAVAYWLVLGVAGAVTCAVTGSGLLFGVGAGALVLAVGQFALTGPSAYLPAARSESEARRRARLGPVVLAAQRRDRAEVIRLTADLPAVPAHWSDSMLLAFRVDAICVLSGATDAARLLRAALDGPPDAMTPVLRALLTTTLFQALVCGDVTPDQQVPVADEIRARTTDPDSRVRSLPVEYVLAAQVGYLDGNWPVAIERSVRATRVMPPGMRGDIYALASLACAAMGDAVSAARYLDDARRDDPDAPLIRAAEARTAATR